MRVTLENKVIVITGSSKGLGKEMAIRFSQEGANIVINYNSSEQEAFDLYTEITKINPRSILVKADVTKQNEVKKLCKETILQFGKVDVLINNAGIAADNLLMMMSETQWKRVIDVNLNGVFHCSRFFSKEMMKQKQGKIINIASLKGQLGSVGQANYCASKAAIVGFTKALAKELGTFNISVNAVAPGFIPTDLNKHVQKEIEKVKNSSFLEIDHCLEDLLNFITLLASDKLNCVSGRVFNLDSRLN